MAYPEEILAELTGKFSLDAQQTEVLRSLLLYPGIQPLVEVGLLYPTSLILTFLRTTIFPLAHARYLVIMFSLYKFSNKNLLNTWVQYIHLLIFVENIPDFEFVPYKSFRARISQVRNDIQEMLNKCESLNMYGEYQDKFVTEYQVTNTRAINLLKNINPAFKEAARLYFVNLFTSLYKTIAHICFKPKYKGTSLGLLMEIIYSDATGSHRIIYYIKLHQHAPYHPVNPIELYAYKVLEHTGNGPKAHFIISASLKGNLLIATQDCAFSKDPKKRKEFACFSTMKNEFCADPERNDKNHEEARKALVRFELLSKIFYLEDTVINSGNFGYIVVDGVRKKWKLLDFSLYLGDGPLTTLPDRDNIATVLLSSDGTVADKPYFPLCSVLTLAQEEHKKKIAQEEMRELHIGRKSQTRDKFNLPLSAAMEKAFSEIVKYCLENCSVLGLQDFAGAINALRYYHFKALENYQRLAIHLAVPIPAKE